MIAETYNEFNEYIDKMTMRLGKPEFTESAIRVPVRDVIVWKEYDNRDQGTRYDRCVFTFSGVIFSYRRISEYLDKSRNSFKQPSYILHDGIFTTRNVSAIYYQYHLEGVSDDLNAYVDWLIIAEQVALSDGKVKR